MSQVFHSSSLKLSVHINNSSSELHKGKIPEWKINLHPRQEQSSSKLCKTLESSSTNQSCLYWGIKKLFKLRAFIRLRKSHASVKHLNHINCQNSITYKYQTHSYSWTTNKTSLASHSFSALKGRNKLVSNCELGSDIPNKRTYFKSETTTVTSQIIQNTSLSHRNPTHPNNHCIVSSENIVQKKAKIKQWGQL